MKTIKDYISINESELISDNNPKIIIISNKLYGRISKPDVDWYKNENQLINEYSHDFINKVKSIKAGEFVYVNTTGFDGYVGKLNN